MDFKQCDESFPTQFQKKCWTDNGKKVIMTPEVIEEIRTEINRFEQ
jgi:hypothetical protein